MDADKAIAARIKHEGKLDEKVDAHFQCAVLYTSAAGQRRVRVHNLAVPVTSLLANVFRFADMDTTIAYVAKDCTSLDRPFLQTTQLTLRSGISQPSRKHPPSLSARCANSSPTPASKRSWPTASTAPLPPLLPKFVSSRAQSSSLR